jgi:GT2 family glycosyltransferase
MTVSIVIVNYNGRNVLPDCLDSLQTNVQRDDVEILVVDNASTDGSVSLIRQSFPSVRLIEQRENLGFGKACNVGAAHAKGSVFLFLNADARCTYDFVTPILRYLQDHPEVGCVGPKLVNEDGSFQLSCGELPTAIREALGKAIAFFVRRKLFGLHLVFERKYAHTQSVGWLTGACLFVRRSAFEQVGGFDERIFLYFEDKDLSLRVAKAGWKVVHFPHVWVIHLLGKGSGSLPPRRLRKLYRESQRYYYRKHLSPVDSMLLSVYLSARRLTGRE